MKNLVKHSQAPESEDLRRKRKELALLEKELAHRKDYLRQLKAELKAFEGKHYQKIFSKFAELDKINEEIIQAKELLSGLTLSDKDISAASRQFEEQFKPEKFLNEENADRVDSGERKRLSESNKELKLIYRKIAKLIHPDLSLDDEDQKYRKDMMARANLAYEAGDEDALLILLDLFQNESTLEKGKASPEITLIARKISKVRIQLADINERIKELESSEVFDLKSKLEKAVSKGLNLVLDMILQLDRQIESAKNELKWLNKELEKKKEQGFDDRK